MNSPTFSCPCCGAVLVAAQRTKNIAKGANKNSRAVLGFFKNRAAKDGSVGAVSHTKIIALTGLSPSVVKRQLSFLVKSGLIVVSRRGGGGNKASEYSLAKDMKSEGAATLVQRETDTASETDAAMKETNAD